MPKDYAAYQEAFGKLTADDADAMDDDAKTEWMEKNIFDPAGDTCPKGETCVFYLADMTTYELGQSCQICDVAGQTTLEMFTESAPTNVEPPASDETEGGDEGDGGEAAEPEEPKAGEEINMIEGDIEFKCLNARVIVYSAGAVAATLAMLY